MIVRLALQRLWARIHIPWTEVCLSVAMFFLTGYSWGCAKTIFTGWPLVAFQVAVWGQCGFFIQDLFRRRKVIRPLTDEERFFTYSIAYNQDKEQQPKETKPEKSNDDIHFSAYLNVPGRRARRIATAVPRVARKRRNKKR